MDALVAIVVFGCEIDGERTESIDVQVRYFDSSDIDAVENRIRTEATHSYLNGDGQTVSWPLLRIAAIEQLEELKDGVEIVGFIAASDGLNKWARDDVA